MQVCVPPGLVVVVVVGGNGFPGERGMDELHG